MVLFKIGSNFFFFFFGGGGFVFDILSSLCLAVLWSPDGKGMISCLSYV